LVPAESLWTTKGRLAGYAASMLVRQNAPFDPREPPDVTAAGADAVREWTNAFAANLIAPRSHSTVEHVVVAGLVQTRKKKRKRTGVEENKSGKAGLKASAAKYTSKVVYAAVRTNFFLPEDECKSETRTYLASTGGDNPPSFDFTEDE